MPGEDLAASGHDGEDDGAEGEELAQGGATEDEAGVAHVVDFRVAELELDEDPGCEEAEGAEKDDDYDARD